MKRNNYCIIYLLTNQVNNKIYIGQSWYELNIRMGKNGSNYKNSVYLYSAINKYGIENFIYTILEKTFDQVEANRLEEEYIVKYDSRNHIIGYNIKGGGSLGKHSEETKQKISQANIGRIVSNETRQKISEATVGIPKSPHTEEWKIANSDFMKRRHVEQEHPMLGRHHTDEAKRAMSEKLTGKPQSAETVAKRITSRMEVQDIQNQVVAAYKQGKTIKEIKAMFGFGGNGKVYRILKVNNIELLNNFSKWIGKEHSESTKVKMSDIRAKYWKQKS